MPYTYGAIGGGFGNVLQLRLEGAHGRHAVAVHNRTFLWRLRYAILSDYPLKPALGCQRCGQLCVVGITADMHDLAVARVSG